MFLRVFYLDLIDLADMQAVVQKLADQPDEMYVNEIIQARGNYILIKVVRKCEIYILPYYKNSLIRGPCPTQITNNLDCFIL